MADWARSLQSGFQTGLQFGEAVRKKREREAYEEIMKETPIQQYSPEQAEQLRAIQGAINPETGQPYYQVSATPGGLDYQVTPNFQYEGSTGAPATISPGYGLLGRTYETMPTESQINTARMSRMADVAAQFGNPAEAQRMRLAASQEERSARGFETGEQLKGLQIGEAEAKAAERANLTNFTTSLTSAIQSDPTFASDPQRIFSLATQSGLTPGQIRTVTADLTGVKEDTLKFVDADIKTKFKKAENLDGVLALDKEDTTYNPGRHHVRRPTKDGFVLDLIDDKTGNVISSSQPFKNDADAMQYLFTQATAPWTQAAVARQIEAADLDRRVKESTIGLNTARAGALGGGADDRTTARLSSASNILGRQVEDIDKRLSDPMVRLTTDQRNALKAERKLKADQLRAVNSQLMTNLGVTVPPPLPELKAGDIVSVGGESREYVSGPVNDPKSYKPVKPAAEPKAKSSGGLRREAPAGSAAAEFDKLKPAGNIQTSHGITYESNLPSFRVGDRRIDPVTGRAVTFAEFVDLQQQRRNTNR